MRSLSYTIVSPMLLVLFVLLAQPQSSLSTGDVTGIQQQQQQRTKQQKQLQQLNHEPIARHQYGEQGKEETILQRHLHLQQDRFVLEEPMNDIPSVAPSITALPTFLIEIPMDDDITILSTTNTTTNSTNKTATLVSPSPTSLAKDDGDTPTNQSTVVFVPKPASSRVTPSPATLLPVGNNDDTQTNQTTVVFVPKPSTSNSSSLVPSCSPTVLIEIPYWEEDDEDDTNTNNTNPTIVASPTVPTASVFRPPVKNNVPSPTGKDNDQVFIVPTPSKVTSASLRPSFHKNDTSTDNDVFMPPSPSAPTTVLSPSNANDDKNHTNSTVPTPTSITIYVPPTPSTPTTNQSPDVISIPLDTFTVEGTLILPTDNSTIQNDTSTDILIRETVPHELRKVLQIYSEEMMKFQFQQENDCAIVIAQYKLVQKKTSDDDSNVMNARTSLSSTNTQKSGSHNDDEQLKQKSSIPLTSSNDFRRSLQNVISIKYTFEGYVLLEANDGVVFTNSTITNNTNTSNSTNRPIEMIDPSIVQKEQQRVLMNRTAIMEYIRMYDDEIRSLEGLNLYNIVFENGYLANTNNNTVPTPTMVTPPSSSNSGETGNINNNNKSIQSKDGTNENVIFSSPGALSGIIMGSMFVIALAGVLVVRRRRRHPDGYGYNFRALLDRSYYDTNNTTPGSSRRVRQRNANGTNNIGITGHSDDHFDDSSETASVDKNNDNESNAINGKTVGYGDTIQLADTMSTLGEYNPYGYSQDDIEVGCTPSPEDDSNNNFYNNIIQSKYGVVVVSNSYNSSPTIEALYSKRVPDIEEEEENNVNKNDVSTDQDDSISEIIKKMYIFSPTGYNTTTDIDDDSNKDIADASNDDSDMNEDAIKRALLSADETIRSEDWNDDDKEAILQTLLSTKQYSGSTVRHSNMISKSTVPETMVPTSVPIGIMTMMDDEQTKEVNRNKIKQPTSPEKEPWGIHVSTLLPEPASSDVGSETDGNDTGSIDDDSYDSDGSSTSDDSSSTSTSNDDEDDDNAKLKECKIRQEFSSSPTTDDNSVTAHAITRQALNKLQYQRLATPVAYTSDHECQFTSHKDSDGVVSTRIDNGLIDANTNNLIAHESVPSSSGSKRHNGTNTLLSSNNVAQSRTEAVVASSGDYHASGRALLYTSSSTNETSTDNIAHDELARTTVINHRYNMPKTSNVLLASSRPSSTKSTLEIDNYPDDSTLRLRNSSSKKQPNLLNLQNDVYNEMDDQPPRITPRSNHSADSMSSQSISIYTFYEENEKERQRQQNERLEPTICSIPSSDESKKNFAKYSYLEPEDVIRSAVLSPQNNSGNLAAIGGQNQSPWSIAAAPALQDGNTTNSQLIFDASNGSQPSDEAWKEEDQNLDGFVDESEEQQIRYTGSNESEVSCKENNVVVVSDYDELEQKPTKKKYLANSRRGRSNESRSSRDNGMSDEKMSLLEKIAARRRERSLSRGSSDHDPNPNLDELKIEQTESSRRRIASRRETYPPPIGYEVQDISNVQSQNCSPKPLGENISSNNVNCITHDATSCHSRGRQRAMIPPRTPSLSSSSKSSAATSDERRSHSTRRRRFNDEDFDNYSIRSKSVDSPPKKSPSAIIVRKRPSRSPPSSATDKPEHSFGSSN